MNTAMKRPPNVQPSVNGIDSFDSESAPMKTVIPTAVSRSPKRLSGRRAHATRPPRMNDQAPSRCVEATNRGRSSWLLEKTSMSEPAVRRSPRPTTAATVNRPMALIEAQRGAQRR
jgi:hypothetical protein